MARTPPPPSSKTWTKLSTLINRPVQEKVEVLNKDNRRRLDEFLLEQTNHWDIVVDYNKFKFELPYIDDRPGHEGEFGVIATVPATITWVVIATSSLPQPDDLTKTTE